VRYEHNTINSPDSVVRPTGFTFDPNTPPFVNIYNPEPRSREGKPVFRVGLNYQPAEYTYIRASWGQGYRFPTIAERYVATRIGGALSILPNPSLQSETGWSAELGIKQGFKISKWMGYVDAALFWTEYQNMMEFNFAGTDLLDFGFMSQNIGNTRIRGFEISVLGSGEIFGAKTNLIGGYTFLDPQFKDWQDGGKQDSLSSADFNFLKYRSRHSAKLDIETFIGKFSIGAAFIWNSRMEAIDQFFSEPGKLLNLPAAWDWFGVKAYRDQNEKNGWVQLDFRAAWFIRPSVKLSFIAENITNNYFTIRPGLPAAPRNFTLRMDYNF
jgi:outer membrane receptor protein involved in Fe transport